MKLALATIALLGSLTHGLHTVADRAAVNVESLGVEALPTTEALRLVTLGQEALVADWYWLRAISHFGDRAAAPAGYPMLAPFLERTLALDPWFAGAYVFAATALTFPPANPRTGARLARPGIEACPDDWRIPFLVGFLDYNDLGDLASGARNIALASERPGAPEHLRPLAVRLAAEAGEPEIGMRLVEAALAELDDERLRAPYEERRLKLLLEVELRDLGRAVEHFARTRGRRPARLEELVEVGIIRALEPDPLGGSYSLDAEGRVVTTSDAQRLRIYRQGARP